MPDKYTWPDSETLQNRLGITDPATLEHFESRITTARDVEALRDPVPGFFNRDHLCRIHEHLFRDLYPWAGQTRTVDISKPGSTFAHWRYVDDQLTSLLSELDGEAYLHGRTRDSFVRRLAELYGDLNAVHPFREGNGRTLRVFLRQLAVGAGWVIDWSELSEDDNVEASRSNLQTADAQILIALLDPLISRG